MSNIRVVVRFGVCKYQKPNHVNLMTISPKNVSLDIKCFRFQSLDKKKKQRKKAMQS